MDMVCPCLKVLFLSDIPRLVELPPSFKKFHKLLCLEISNCINLETFPTDINLKFALDLSGCSRLRSFPNISRFSTNLSYLFLDRTGIEEVPWWIEDFSQLKYLRMNGCNKLHSVSLNMSKLEYLDTVDFSDCGELTNANLIGYKLPAPQDASSSSLPDNFFSTSSLDFFNCFKLDQEALIQKQLVFCKLLMLSGERVPSYFTHRTTGTSTLDISVFHAPHSQRSFKLKVCVVVECESIPMAHDTFKIQVACRLIGRTGNHFDVACPSLYIKNLKLGSQLVIFEFSIPINEEKARKAELYYMESLLKGYLQLETRQVYLDHILPGLDLEEPPQHEVPYNIKEWGIDAPISNKVQNEVPSCTFGSSSSHPKKNFHQGYYLGPVQTEANAPTTPQESKTDLLLQQLMESQKQIIDGQKQNTKETKDLNVKMEGIYNDLNGKFELLVAHVRKLEVQVTQTIEDVKKQAETEVKTFYNTASIQEEKDYVPISKQTLKLKDVMIQPKLHDKLSPRELMRAQTSKLEICTLPKQENLGKFLVPYSIDGFKFNEFICDTGAKVNFMSKITADERRFLYLPGVLLQIGNCSFPIDVHIVEMRKNKHMPLVLGYEFLAVVGALVDFPNKRISFTKIDKNVFYPAVQFTGTEFEAW